MLAGMADRGPDSAGLAVYHDAVAGEGSKLTLFAPEAEAGAWGVTRAAVFGAGNWGTAERPAYPAAYDSVIAITALDHKDRLYKMANRGPYVSVAAPGARPSTRPGH